MYCCLLILGVLSTVTAVFPPGWKPCRKSSPPLEHNECMRMNIQTALNSLAKGIPEMNIASLEPYSIPNRVSVTGKDGLNLITVNGTEYGFFDAKILQVESTPWKKLRIVMLCKLIKLNFNYIASGDLYGQQIRSAGDGLFLYGDTTREIRIRFAEYEMNGKKYLKVEDLKLAKKVKFFHPEFHSYGECSSNNTKLNSFVAENWRELISAQQLKASEQILTEIINMILSKIPMEEFENA